MKTETKKTQETTLPPHLVAALNKYEEKKKAFLITDVTPKGYGPSEAK